LPHLSLVLVASLANSSALARTAGRKTWTWHACHNTSPYSELAQVDVSLFLLFPTPHTVQRWCSQGPASQGRFIFSFFFPWFSSLSLWHVPSTF
jgi:hypothetical protein